MYQRAEHVQTLFIRVILSFALCAVSLSFRLSSPGSAVCAHRLCLCLSALAHLHQPRLPLPLSPFAAPLPPSPPHILSSIFTFHIRWPHLRNGQNRETNTLPPSISLKLSNRRCCAHIQIVQSPLQHGYAHPKIHTRQQALGRHP